MKDSNYGDWYNWMVRKLQINGKSERTQAAYTRAVHQLIIHLKKNPETITEKELEDYFLYRRNEREWNIFSILKSQKEQRLPAVLPNEEVHLILSHVKTFHNFVFFSTVYACGLKVTGSS